MPFIRFKVTEINVRRALLNSATDVRFWRESITASHLSLTSFLPAGLLGLEFLSVSFSMSCPSSFCLAPLL